MPHETVDGSSCTNRKTLLNTGCNNSEQDVYLVNAIHVVVSGLREELKRFCFGPCHAAREQVSIFVWITVCVLLVCTELESPVYADWKLQSSKRCIWNKDSIFCNKIVVRAFCARPVNGKYLFVQLPNALFLVINLAARFYLKKLCEHVFPKMLNFDRKSFQSFLNVCTTL